MDAVAAERQGPALWGRGEWAIVFAGIALAGIAAAIGLANTGADDRVFSAISNTATIAIFIGVGLFAWRRNPENSFGRLLVLAGVGWFFVSLAASDSPALYSFGRASAWIEEVLLIYLFLSYPNDRPQGLASRVVVGVAAATVLLLYLPTTFLVDGFPTPSPYAACGGDCPTNAFQVTSTQPAFVDDLVRPLREVLTIGVFFATAVILLARLARSTPVLRRTLVPVLLAALLSAFASALYVAARRGGADDATLHGLETLRGLTNPLAGLGFLIGLVMWQLYEARALERMALSPTIAAPPARLEQLLREAFEDPSLELRFAVKDGWTDAGGARTAPPSSEPDRCVVEIASGAIVCDPGLSAHTRLVRAAGTWVAMATEREHLTHMLSDSLHDVEDSRRRLATATATERRRIERDLHDGAQQRLVTLRVQLQLVDEELEHDPAAGARRLRKLGSSVDAAIDDVRSLARGIYPPLLADAGLAEALRAVAARETLPVTVQVDNSARYPVEVESAAYFCCLEALQNSAKHSGAGGATVAISSAPDLLRFTVSDTGRGFERNGRNGGAGLTNMRDRLAAVGGRLEIESVPGSGTKVTGEVPVEAPA
jgi:signal transduction histidine kinase